MATTPHKSSISYFVSHVNKQLDNLLPTYENMLILGDLNSPISKNEMRNFSELYNLKNLTNELTCYKNAANPSSIVVMLTNKKGSIQISMVLETGLSDHHKMTISVLKRCVKKKAPLIRNYRNYKNYNEENFRYDLIRHLNSQIMIL